MNVYLNTKKTLNLNENILLREGTTLFLESENAKEHRLGEDQCTTYRLLIDDQNFFNPFREIDMDDLEQYYPNPVQFGGRTYPRADFFETIFLNKDTNKAAIIWKHTREVLKLQCYLGAYYLEGTMMSVHLLSNMNAMVTDKTGYHARVSFRDAKGYDPITKAVIQKNKM